MNEERTGKCWRQMEHMSHLWLFHNGYIIFMCAFPLIGDNLDLERHQYKAKSNWYIKSERTERTITNGQSRDVDNIGHTWHRTKTNMCCPLLGFNIIDSVFIRFPLICIFLNDRSFLIIFTVRLYILTSLTEFIETSWKKNKFLKILKELTLLDAQLVIATVSFS